MYKLADGSLSTDHGSDAVFVVVKASPSFSIRSIVRLSEDDGTGLPCFELISGYTPYTITGKKSAFISWSKLVKVNVGDKFTVNNKSDILTTAGIVYVKGYNGVHVDLGLVGNNTNGNPIKNTYFTLFSNLVPLLNEDGKLQSIYDSKSLKLSNFTKVIKNTFKKWFKKI